jgi:hypothetical protein
MASVLQRRLIRPLDDQQVHRILLRFQLEPELFLQAGLDNAERIDLLAGLGGCTL